MRYGIALLFACLLAVPAAGADNASQPLQMTGSVPVRCRLSPPSAGVTVNTSFTPDANGGNLVLTALVDMNTSTTLSAEGSILVPILCSGTHALTVTSHGGLNNQNATASGGFLTHVDYELTATWGATTQTVQTAGSAVTLDLSQNGPQSGDLTIAVSLPAGRGPLVAGTYTDEIIIELNAQ